MSSTESAQNPGEQLSSWMKENNRVVHPRMDDPEETMNEIRRIHKMKLPHLEAASAELAPEFGLGDTLIGTQRAQNLFTHPALQDSFLEFAKNYLEGQWEMPLGEWGEVHKLVHAHRDDASWVSGPGPDRKGWQVNHFYARFVLVTLAGIKRPDGPRDLVYWLEEARFCDATWVLTHALMYLQLEVMRDYRKHAPVKDRISHFINSWKVTTEAASPAI